MLAILVCQFAACAHATSTGKPPKLVVEHLLPTLCEAFLKAGEGGGNTTIVVLQETRPVFQTFGLRVLRDFKPLDPAAAVTDERRDAELEQAFEPSWFETNPRASIGCRWALTGKPFAALKGTNEVVLELSGIVPDPFYSASEGPTNFGLFGRLTLGGRHPSWFWIDVKTDTRGWLATSASELSISDD